MTVASTTPPGYWAARLALLALRAGLPKRAPLDADAFVLPPSVSRLNADTAARTLAALDKPLYCMAGARNRAVHIECGPLADSPLPPSHIRRNDALSPMVRQRFGEDVSSLRVIWLGREERLNVSLADVAEFYRGYDCFPFGGAGADWVDSRLAKSHHITPESADGAVAVYQVFPVDLARYGCAFPLPRWLGRLIVSRHLHRMQPPGSQRDA